MVNQYTDDPRRSWRAFWRSIPREARSCRFKSIRAARATQYNFSEVKIEEVPPDTSARCIPIRRRRPIAAAAFALRRAGVLSSALRAAADRVADAVRRRIGRTGRITWHLSVINGGQPRQIERRNRIQRLSRDRDVRSRDVERRRLEPRRRMDHRRRERHGGEELSFRPARRDAGGRRLERRRHERDRRVPRRPVVPRSRRQRTLGRGRSLGETRRRRTTSRWPAIGTATARPTSASSASAWIGDVKAIEAEPGLPDALNPPKNRYKNIPPDPAEAAVGFRTMKRTNAGKIRSDLIDHVFEYGTTGDRAVVGDWTGDGIKKIGVFRDGTWYLDIDGDGRWSAADVMVQFGREGDLPVVGDWTGDGVTKLGVYRNGTFYPRHRQQPPARRHRQGLRTRRPRRQALCRRLRRQRRRYRRRLSRSAAADGQAKAPPAATMQSRTGFQPVGKKLGGRKKASPFFVAKTPEGFVRPTSVWRLILAP